MEVLAEGLDASALSQFDVAVWKPGHIPIEEIPPEVPVLALGPGDAGVMLTALDAGAQGYLDLAASDEELADAVRQVAAGYSVVSPLLLGPLLRSVVERRRGERAQRSMLNVLTAREREVFILAAKGHSRRELAERLVISPATARTHLQNVMAKLDLHSQAELVALAARCGIDTGSSFDE
jgi:DNA-binding NarL/FixJ family response regulator